MISLLDFKVFFTQIEYDFSKSRISTRNDDPWKFLSRRQLIISTQSNFVTHERARLHSLFVWLVSVCGSLICSYLFPLLLSICLVYFCWCGVCCWGTCSALRRMMNGIYVHMRYIHKYSCVSTSNWWSHLVFSLETSTYFSRAVAEQNVSGVCSNGREVWRAACHYHPSLVCSTRRSSGESCRTTNSVTMVVP